MELTGKIIEIFDEQQVSDSFVKKECVIETQGDYPQKIKIEFVQDAVSKLNTCNIDDNVRIAINIRGREWLDKRDNTTKYFNSIQGWKIDKVGSELAEGKVKKVAQSDDDLPF